MNTCGRRRGPPPSAAVGTDTADGGSPVAGDDMALIHAAATLDAALDRAARRR